MPVTFGGDQRAESGIGALLVFIAMIMVAAVAASVLMQTTYMAQERAQQVAESAIQEVSSGFRVLSVIGDRYNYTSGTLDSKIDTLIIDVTPNAGSGPIDMRRVIIEVTDGKTLGTLSYGGIGTPNLATAQYYVVQVLRDPKGLFTASNPIVSDGAIIRIYINASAVGLNLTTSTELIIKIIPQPGIPTTIQTITPDVYVSRYVAITI